MKAYAGLCRALYADPRTPRASRALLWLAAGYALLPFDLIPDFLPGIGHLDDAVILPALILGALWLVPEAVRREHLQRMELELARG